MTDDDVLDLIDIGSTGGSPAARLTSPARLGPAAEQCACASRSDRIRRALSCRGSRVLRGCQSAVGTWARSLAERPYDGKSESQLRLLHSLSNTICSADSTDSHWRSFRPIAVISYRYQARSWRLGHGGPVAPEESENCLTVTVPGQVQCREHSLSGSQAASSSLIVLIPGSPARFVNSWGSATKS